MKELEEKLRSLADPDYRDFTAALIPTLPRERILGIALPKLRELAKEMEGSAAAKEFMAQLPHRFYDEDCLHAALICRIKDYDSCLEALSAFLPYIDNWSTCDTLSPKALGKNRNDLAKRAALWTEDSRCYVCRFGLGMLKRYFLDDSSAAWALELASKVDSGEYYVQMMLAWLFAEALVKQPELALDYIRRHRLNSWVHNKATQKARESRRVSPEMKELLKSLKV